MIPFPTAGMPVTSGEGSMCFRDGSASLQEDKLSRPSAQVHMRFHGRGRRSVNVRLCLEREKSMSAINLSQFLANKVRSAGEALTAAVEKMPDDRIVWHPATEGNQGRDALDQALECAYLNEWVAE